MVELHNVAGGHARNYFEFAPKSMVVRLTPKFIAGFNTYGFTADGSWSGVVRLNADDLPANEFYLAGDIVRTMSEEQKKKLTEQGAHLFSNADELLKVVKKDFLG